MISSISLRHYVQVGVKFCFVVDEPTSIRPDAKLFCVNLKGLLSIVSGTSRCTSRHLLNELSKGNYTVYKRELIYPPTNFFLCD